MSKMSVVPNVQLLDVGEDWETSTGIFSFTPEDLVSIVQSQDDPSVRSPVIKLGHVDPRFDGQPALGKVINLRVTNNGQTLVGDLVGLPTWLTDKDDEGNMIIAAAYPRRSIEGQFDYTSKTGMKWSLILTGLALLGDSYPAINTLDDIQALWGETPPKLVPVEATEELVAATSSHVFCASPVVKAHLPGKHNQQTHGGGGHKPVNEMSRKGDGDRMKCTVKKAGDELPVMMFDADGYEVLATERSTGVRAAKSVEDIRRAFYDVHGKEHPYWWVREVRVDPLELVVDDDNGGLYTLSVKVKGEEITFGSPKGVKIEYVAATYTSSSNGDVTWEPSSQVIAASYVSAHEAGRPDTMTHDASTSDPDDNSNPTQEAPKMLTEEALAKLGLPADATPDAISAAILQQLGSNTGDPTTPPPDGDGDEGQPPVEDKKTLEIPEGLTLIDNETLARLQDGLVAATELKQEREVAERNGILDDAIRAGKFPPARRAHYEQLLCADPVGGRQLLASLAPGLVPVIEQGSGREDAGDPEDNAYPESWKRTVAASNRHAAGNIIKVVND